MKFSRRRVLAGVAAIAFCLAAAPRSQASEVSGSLGLGNPGGVTLIGSGDLFLATGASFGASFTSNSPTDDYVPIPDGTAYVPSGALTFAAPAGFALTDGIYGSFTVAALLSDTPFSFGGSKFRNLVYSGTYTPGPGLPGKDPTGGRLNLTFTQIGSSVTVAGVIQTSGVPEPATYVSAALGALGLLGFRRFRRRLS